MSIGSAERRYIYQWQDTSILIELQDSRIDVAAESLSAVDRATHSESCELLTSERLAARICRSPSVQVLEASLRSLIRSENSCANNVEASDAIQQLPTLDQPDVYYPPRSELAYLSCQRMKRHPTPSVTGLVEELEGEPPTHERCGRVSFRHWKHVSSDDEFSSSNERDSPLSLPGQSHQPPRPKTISSRDCQLSYIPSHRRSTHEGLQWTIDLVDLLSAAAVLTAKPTPAYAYHFLRSLLSPINTHSPWLSEDVDDDRLDLVMLLLPGRSPLASLLQEFRLSDACPSWYLHAVASLSNKDELDTGSRCLVYRRMPPRTALSSVHWENLNPAPVPGCLWEWYRPPPAGDAVQVDNVSDSRGSNDDSGADEEPRHAIRLVGPPFFDALTEFPELQVLLDQLSVVQEEARTISQWTAWPEEQHYSSVTGEEHSGEDGSGGAAKSVPWTVFPLCYCFPADDESKRSWVPVTSQAVPRTTKLLQGAGMHRLRTALFSRLAPGALLFAHTGWADLANHVLRVHVPVILPPASTVTKRPEMSLCGLWVDGVVQTLAPNELVCFDDSKMHWAFNYDQQERIVLILDFARPSDLPVGTATGGHTEELDRFILQAQGLPY